MLISNAIDSFLFHCRYERNLSKNTMKSYQIDLKQFHNIISINDRIITVNQITKDMISEFLRISLTTLKSKSVKRKIVTIKAFLKFLEQTEVISTSPFQKLSIKIKEEIRMPRTISMTDIERIFSYIYALKNSHTDNGKYNSIVRDIAILELLFSTGARVSEISCLRKANIDFTKGSICITGKGNKERIVPICSKDVNNIVKEYSDLFASHEVSSSFFFINRRKNRLSEQSIRNLVCKYAEGAGLQTHVTPHMLRHSIATLMLENGIDISYIQNLLGHSSIQTTLIYLRINEGAQRKILMQKHPRRNMKIKLNAG